MPDGDGTTLELTVQPSTPTTHFDKVDEGISGADDGTTTLLTTNNNTSDDFLQIEDMPTDFGDAIDFIITARTQITGVVDDVISALSQVFESTETANVGNNSGLAGNHTWTDTSASNSINTENKATWNTHKIRLRASRSNTGMPDDVTIEFTAVEVVINYDVATGGDGTDIPYLEVEQPRKIVIKVVASGPRPG